MDTEDEIARDEFINDLYNEFANDILAGKDDEVFFGIVEKFASERLQSFYRDHPDVAKDALWALSEARALRDAHPSAALVFAVAAMEVGLRGALLKPILHGLVHAEFAGALVAELAGDRQDKSKGLVFAILAEYGGIDLKTYKRTGSAKTLWEEMADAQKTRNVVAHRAQPCEAAEAATATELAGHIVETVFPEVIRKLGLHTHGANLKVCGEKH